MTRSSTLPRLATALMALGVWMLAMGMVATTAAAGPNDFQFLDGFESGGFNGNAGADKFSGPWFEYQDWGGAGKGAVSVESSSDCPKDRCTNIEGDGEAMAGVGLARWADIEGAAIARVKFKYRRDVDEGEGSLKIVVNDGSAWRTIHEIPLDREDEVTGTKTITVTEFANRNFAIGFFVHGRVDGAIYIDDVMVFGSWETPTTTTAPPTTTTETPTTTSIPTTTSSPTPTTAAPTTTLGPTAPPSTPTTTIAPVTSQPPATTTQPPTTVPPIEDDSRYTQKGELASHLILVDSMMEMPTVIDQIPAPTPVTQIMASITTTAVTIRSHLPAAVALGVIIAIGALWGLGRRRPA